MLAWLRDLTRGNAGTMLGKGRSVQLHPQTASRPASEGLFRMWHRIGA
jgi:hypothetical protein